MMNNIKAIIFDWGGVCCTGGEPFASLALQKALSLAPEEISARASFYEGYYTGEYDYKNFWQAIIKFFNLTEDEEINPESLSKCYLNSYAICLDVLDFVRELGKKYKVALLSDLTPELRDHIKDKHQLDNFFDLQVYSCDLDVRAQKVSGKPFEVVLRKLGLAGEECVFIDNSEEKIVKAQEMGFQTILFKDLEQTKKDIKKFL